MCLGSPRLSRALNGHTVNKFHERNKYLLTQVAGSGRGVETVASLSVRPRSWACVFVQVGWVLLVKHNNMRLLECLPHSRARGGLHPFYSDVRYVIVLQLQVQCRHQKDSGLSNTLQMQAEDVFIVRLSHSLRESRPAYKQGH